MASLRAFTRRTPTFFTSSYVQRASFTSASRIMAGKESALDTEGRAEEIEAHKDDAVKKAKAGKGEWKEPLASDSESIVKADREELEASEATIKKLQEETKNLEGKK